MEPIHPPVYFKSGFGREFQGVGGHTPPLVAVPYGCSSSAAGTTTTVQRYCARQWWRVNKGKLVSKAWCVGALPRYLACATCPPAQPVTAATATLCVHPVVDSGRRGCKIQRFTGAVDRGGLKRHATGLSLLRGRGPTLGGAFCGPLGPLGPLGGVL